MRFFTEKTSYSLFAGFAHEDLQDLLGFLVISF